MISSSESRSSGGLILHQLSLDLLARLLYSLDEFHRKNPDVTYNIPTLLYQKYQYSLVFL